jgi:hypothetical protein
MLPNKSAHTPKLPLFEKERRNMKNNGTHNKQKYTMVLSQHYCIEKL